MIQVNAFWFGFLIGIISLIALLAVIGMFHKPYEDDMEPITIEELRQIIKEEMDGEEGKHGE